MGLPYPSMNFTAFDPLPAAELNKFVANDASLEDGTGFNNGLIISRHLASGISVPNVMFNPYKFLMYRSASFTSASVGFQEMPFDTKVFDTGNNCDVTTNMGRFTVPVSGFYRFSAGLLFVIGGTSQHLAISIQKNSVNEIVRLQEINSGINANHCISGTSPLLSLTAGDAIEVFFYTGTALSVGVGSGTAYFGGQLEYAS